MNKIKNIMYPIISLLVVYIAWLSTSFIINESILLPGPNESIKVLFKELSDIAIYTSVLNSLLRSLLSFILSFIFGFILAIISLNNNVRRIISPMITMIKSIPTMAIIIILVLLISANIAPMIVSFIIIMPLIYSSILDSILSVDRNYLEMAHLYEVNKKRIIRKIYIPHIAIGINEAISQALGLSLKLVISAEVMSHPLSGIGNMMHIAKLNLEIPRLFSLVIISIILSLIIEGIYKLISKGVLWRLYEA